MNQDITQKEDFQTPTRGPLYDEYQIYYSHADAMGWKVKSFEEWLET